MKKQVTISLLVTTSFLFITNASKAQGFSVSGANTYTNPLANYVGFGTTTPFFPVDISNFINAGSISSGNNFEMGLNAGNAAVGTQSTTRNAVFGTTAANKDILFVNFDFTGTGTYLEHMRITNPGNVGIGTATPNASALLHVSSSSKGILIPQVQLSSTSDATTITLPATSLLVYNILGGGLTPAGYWYNAGTSGSPNWVQLISTATSGSWLLAGNSISSGDFIGTTNNMDFIVKTNNTEKMRVLSGGNVGIGTATPTHRLSVVDNGASSTHILGVHSDDQSPWIAGFYNDTYSTSVPVFEYFGYNTSQSSFVAGDFEMGNPSAKRVSIYTNGYTNPRLTVDGIGNVGIGTTSPAAALHVAKLINGEFEATRLQNLNGSGSDITSVSLSFNHFTSSNPSAKIVVKETGGSASYQSQMQFWVRNATSDVVPDVQAITILPSGNVGIGTTAPAQKLHVVSNAAALRLEGTDHTFMEFFPDGPTTRKAWFGFGGASDNNITLLNENNGAHIIFSTTGTGKVGIGTTAPGAKLDVNGTSNFNGNMAITGNFHVNGIATCTNMIWSDSRIKTNIDSLQNSLTTINQLKPKSFYFDTANVYGLNFSSKKQYGFIAQEVETILPELISSLTKLADIDTLGNIIHPAFTFKTLNYNAFIGILTKGIQELQQKNDSLETKTIKQDSINTALQNIQQKSVDSLNTKNNKQDSTITFLQNQLNQLASLINDCCNNHDNGHGNNLMQSGTNNYKSLSSTTLTDVELSNKNIVVLDQNVPNPFAEQTTISYFLPDNISRAQILFFEQSGKIIKTIDLTDKGKGTLNIFANDLSNGIYTYSLIIDGQTVETKKMVKQ